MSIEPPHSMLVSVHKGNRRHMKRKIDNERRAEIGAEKRARTRRKLLSIAFSLFGREHGRSTNVEEVCLGAGVARGTFYNYFESFDELTEALSYEAAHELNVMLERLVGDFPPGAMQSSYAIRYYLSRALADARWGWALVNLTAAGPIFGAETAHLSLDAVQQGLASGDFDLPDVLIGRDIMQGSTLAAMTTLLRGERGGDYVAIAVRQILSALGAQSALIDACLAIPLTGLED